VTPLLLDPARLRYRTLVGTGGIGSGMFFALDGDHTLGREESRSGRILDRRDYCKLHIIAHYVAVLAGEAMRVFPVGRVGEDDAGRKLMGEMKQAGMDLRHVKALPETQTLFSFCFTYPDKSGGNMTVNDSACSRVTVGAVQDAEPLLAEYGGKCMVLAAPEVPMESRVALLRMGTRHGCFRSASFASGEMEQVRSENILDDVDYLAINVHEAALLAGVSAEQTPQETVNAAIKYLGANRPGLICSITAGRHGSWTWDGRTTRHLPPVEVRVASTAGAGDAFMAGMLVGLAAGFAVAEAHELANFTGSLSVSSPHTIHPGLDRVSLRELLDGSGLKVSSVLRGALEG